MTPGHVAVIDIGKTNAKLAVVETEGLTEVDVVTTANTVLQGAPYPHFDVDTIWTFLLDGLGDFHRKHRIDAISITTHGASAALIAADGSLAAPILDYEYTGPDRLAEAYDTLRPTFEETGSPRLPMGLNLGAQLHWQFAHDPTLLDRTAAIVTYPQYWGHRLTGQLATDVTSLGCHTDLWDPFGARFSSLVARLSIADKIAPARKSSDVLGPVLPAVAEVTGLDANTPVHCGIHDSNASLLPHVMRRDAPFSVVSTGTWVIAMTVGGANAIMDPSRDVLVNVDALGNPVPSARFMGGREYETILAGGSADCDASSLEEVAKSGPMLMPAVVAECGPFQNRKHCWIGGEPAHDSPVRAAALGFYLALVTAECLLLTGHRGTIVVEGPFAANTGFCTMLAVATGCTVEAAGSTTGTSHGAAMLALGQIVRSEPSQACRFEPEEHPEFAPYAARWREILAGGQKA